MTDTIKLRIIGKVKEKMNVGNYKHGHAAGNKSREYIAWRNMLSRCYNPNNVFYHYYGGRGIVVEKSLQAFPGFLKALGSCPDGLTLDRVNTNGSYTQKNCRWASTTQQQQNKRSNVLITYKKVTLCLAEWARRVKINRTTLVTRCKLGWSPTKMLTTPVYRAL